MSYNIVQDYTEHKYIEHKFTLDCKKSQSQVSIPVRENDTAIKLFITLQDGREPFYIEDGCISAIFIKKSDGTICENACIIEDNRTIRYDFTEGTANVEGINDCEVRVYSADGTMLTSPRFIMVVTNRVLSDDKITEDERTIMDKILLSELGRVNAENFRKEEETVRRENEVKRVQAEEDREDIFSKKIDEINGKLAKGNLLVFDTKEHLNQFIGGYESTKNLCPLPRIHSNDKYTLTHNDNGTFNFDVSHDIGEPEPFGSITLEPGVYVFTRYNCEFYIGITFDQMIPISKPFEVTKTTEYDLFSSGYAGDSFKNAWVQITKGESVPDEFIPYYAPYIREDGKTVNDLSPGDILLITEEGVSDYWWDGNAIRPIEAQADQTFNRESENAQSGKAVAEALSGYVVAEVGKGLSSNDFTNEDKEKLYSALQNENVDQTYIPNSENPQSGKAVAEAVSDKQDSLVSGTNIKTINNQSILGSGNITIEGGSDVEVDQIYLPTSENAQSGKAVAEAVEPKADKIEVNKLKGDLGGIYIEVKPENIFDKDTMAIVKKWYIGAIGSVANLSDAAAYSAIKIPVSNIDTVSIKQNMSVGDVMVYSWFTVDTDMVIISKDTPNTSIKDGYTITGIDETAKFLLLSLTYYESAITEGNYLSVVVGDAAKDYSPYFKPYRKVKIADGSVTENKIADGSVTPQKTSFMELKHGDNLFDWNTMTYENYWYTGFTVGSKASKETLDSSFH